VTTKRCGVLRVVTVSTNGVQYVESLGHRTTDDFVFTVIVRSLTVTRRIVNLLANSKYLASSPISVDPVVAPALMSLSTLWALELSVGKISSVLVYSQYYTAPVSGALMLATLCSISHVPWPLLEVIRVTVWGGANDVRERVPVAIGVWS
jgi:hypothetical protein